MDLALAGRHAFVAGASRGIGLAIAHAFAAEGAVVTITGRNPESLEHAQRQLAAAGATAHALRADMCDPAQVRAALDQAEDLAGPPTAVVGNLGSGTSLPGVVIPEEHWLAVLRTNLLGATALATEALPRLERVTGGSLTFISSIAGVEAIGAPIAYAAAKAALNQAVKGYARQMGAKGVRVNAVAPGNVLFPGGSWETKLRDRPEFCAELLRTEVPLQRFGTPDEIAAAVVFLASEKASFCTGTIMVVDGGQTRS